MLDFIPDEIICAEEINPHRIFKLNNKEILKGDIIYLITRDFRIEDNWGLLFAWDLAKQHGQKLKVIVDLSKVAISQAQKDFIKGERNFLEKNFALNNIDFEFGEDVPQKAGAFVVDFNPVNLYVDFAKNSDCAVFEVDSHNIIPARFISEKQEYSAATLRRKVYANIANFLTEFPNPFVLEESSARVLMNDFIQSKLDSYNLLKNDPNEDAVSGLSKYFHFGLISAQRVALEVLKSDTSRQNKEVFLEELIVRKELSDNFCLYNREFRSLKGAPDWAKATLMAHKSDLRSYVYSRLDFEGAKTHDALWNAAQKQLLKEGKIHGYMRMYWAKKILEWSASPEEAIEIAIFLNDKYAIDGNDPNGYVGILWSIAGVHDRAFSHRPIFGQIRYMSEGGCKNKFDVNEYTKKNNCI